MARACLRLSSSIFALVAFVLNLQTCASASTVIVVNHGQVALDVTKPQKTKVLPGGHWVGRLGKSSDLELQSAEWKESYSPKVAFGSYAAVAVHANNTISAYDTNDIQLQISSAAHTCLDKHDRGHDAWQDCISDLLLGGVPRHFSTAAFIALWQDHNYWWLCEPADPSQSIRGFKSRYGYQVDILREKPLVAAVRGFVNSSTCSSLMNTFDKDSLARAHIGAGGGATAVSESRETLSKNMFVDWNKHDALSATSAHTFDLASELLGDEIPYEGQEPLNFLHYLRGFEYKPHQDGRAESLGKRVATTLVYCEAADVGGATVFPNPGVMLKFSPSAGDLLFFTYAPKPQEALHSACPVVEGSKSTLTQWHRLGVAPEKPWDNYEQWGSFHNPYGKSRWKGARYGGKKAEL